MSKTLLLPSHTPRDLDAEFYAKSSCLQRSLTTQIINRLQLASNADVLDIECGDGKITAILADRVKRGSVLGVNYNPLLFYRGVLHCRF